MKEGRWNVHRSYIFDKKLHWYDEKMKGHKLLIKNCKKSLDFSGQDEYNTLSTQRKGVLNNRKGAREASGSWQSLNYILL